MAARKGLDPYNVLAPKAAAGTKEDPNLVPSITNKRIVGCICEEDDSTVIWFRLAAQRRGPAMPQLWNPLQAGAPPVGPSCTNLLKMCCEVSSF